MVSKCKTVPEDVAIWTSRCFLVSIFVNHILNSVDLVATVSGIHNHVFPLLLLRTHHRNYFSLHRRLLLRITRNAEVAWILLLAFETLSLRSRDRHFWVRSLSLQFLLLPLLDVRLLGFIVFLQMHYFLDLVVHAAISWQYHFFHSSLSHQIRGVISISRRCGWVTLTSRITLVASFRVARIGSSIVNLAWQWLLVYHTVLILFPWRKQLVLDSSLSTSSLSIYFSPSIWLGSTATNNCLSVFPKLRWVVPLLLRWT